MANSKLRHLVIVLGDQLNTDSAVFELFDAARDCVWMAEVPGESTHVRSHKARIVLFLSAMRHFRAQLQQDGLSVVYHRLGQHAHPTIEDALSSDLARLNPERLIMAQAGEYRLQRGIERVAQQRATPLEIVADRHFVMSIPEFAAWSEGRKAIRTEHLYRYLRIRTETLIENGKPAGGRWNFDAENRKNFGRSGPGTVSTSPSFGQDGFTRDAMQDVGVHFADHPGTLDEFDWPLTRTDARHALADFIANRLPGFGAYQDAMWTGEPFLYHSRLSAALNLKLLAPLEVIGAAIDAYRQGLAPLSSVEGFVRQILGWRELVRGIYWTRMPAYLHVNSLAARQPLPAFYWTGETEMACLREVIGQTLRHGYAHHIQRLMVTGLFALLLGVEPQQVHEWYLAMYVDAVEWVEAPNTVGMSQYADGGVMASKPYVASGRYIARMSNYCRGCRFKPEQATGPEACPYTTLYWDFLLRHRCRFEHHPRTARQWKNLARLDSETIRTVSEKAERIRTQLAG